MEPFTTAALRELAAQRDMESVDSYVSLYLDAKDTRRDTLVDARARDVRAALGEDRSALAEFEGSLALARGALRGAPPEARGVVAFASKRHGLSRAFWTSKELRTRLVLDSSPYLRPLARYADEHEAFALVVVEGEAAAIHVVALGRAELSSSRRIDLIGRHKKGGMSQARYQRHRRGMVEKHLDEVVGQIDRLLQEGEVSRVVLAGPGQAKRHLLQRLSTRAKEAVIAVEDVEIDDTREIGGIIARVGELARDHETMASREAVDALRTAMKRGELAVAGPFETARAARDGRADLVLLLKDHKAGGAKCEKDNTFFEAQGKCPICGSAGTEVDLLNEAVEGALLSDATVEFVPAKNETLRAWGGAGALLRW